MESSQLARYALFIKSHVCEAITMVNSKQLSIKIVSTQKLSVQTRQAPAQENSTGSGENDYQEDLMITNKMIIKEKFDKHKKEINEMIKLHLQSINCKKRFKIKKL